MNKRRRCKLHNQFTETWVKYPFGCFCTSEAASEFAIKKMTKDREKQRKASKRAQKAKKQQVKLGNVPHQLKITQEAFNKLRRLQELKWYQDRGQEPVCMACLKPKGNDVWCNSHVVSVGASSYLRFDPVNSFLAHNFACNVHKSGDPESVKVNLLKRFGEQEGKRIVDYLETAPKSRKYTGEELKEMRTKFYAEIRELEKVVDY